MYAVGHTDTLKLPRGDLVFVVVVFLFVFEGEVARVEGDYEGTE